MRFEEVKRYKVNDDDIIYFYETLIDEIESEKSFFKNDTHEKIKCFVESRFLKQKEIYVTFDKPYYKNGIGNNWSVKIIGTFENNPNSEIELGTLHITDNMFGKELVFFKSPGGQKTEICEIRTR